MRNYEFWALEVLGWFLILVSALLKAYVSEEILNWHCLSLNADLCIHFYWLSRLRQASYRKKIQSSALTLRLWLCHFKISSDTPTLSWLLLRILMNPLISDCHVRGQHYHSSENTILSYTIYIHQIWRQYVHCKCIQLKYMGSAVCTLQINIVELRQKCNKTTALPLVAAGEWTMYSGSTLESGTQWKVVVLTVKIFAV